jgi:hypothetical protein
MYQKRRAEFVGRYYTGATKLKDVSGIICSRSCLLFIPSIRFVAYQVHDMKHNGEVTCLYFIVDTAKMLYEETNKCTYELYTLFIDHTYMFRSPSATIFRVYSVKIVQQKLFGESVQHLNL